MTNTTVFRNTAVGVQALGNLVSGFDNIAIWLNAGFSLNSGEARNIDIDHSGVAAGTPPFASELYRQEHSSQASTG
jgi:hypothetical protein